jgi:hypothetical protein
MVEQESGKRIYTIIILPSYYNNALLHGDGRLANSMH